jgi:triacylglycerol esterase/lipase EstA (alpha/beta hydrolase family)
MMQRILIHTLSTVLLICVLLLSGCATPFGVNAVSPRESYREAYANPLNAGVLGDQAKYVLNRYDLLTKFDKEPASAIAVLHEKALHDDREDILYTLAECSYLYGSQLADSYNSDNNKLAPDYFLLSALYSYYFISGETSRERLNIFDHRSRTAVDMYNFGLWQGFATGDSEGLVLKAAVRKLPFGSISISLDTSQFPWKMEEFEKFLPADKYSVRGVLVRNRKAGVGLPLIGVRKITGNGLSAGQATAATALLRIKGDLTALSAGTASAGLELYSTQDTSTINSKFGAIPLESDLTTPMAYKLEGSDLFDLGLSAFLGREPNKISDGLYMTEPYRPGKIPVVFVHGTASNPVWWVEMFNTLRFDPLIREKYQFWYFVYTSNKAIALSAGELRSALSNKVATLDPQGKDPALQQMVVAGHSQGGLLTKFTVVDTGDSLVQALTGKDLDSLQMSEENKAKVRRVMVLKPLPFVKEVIFLSTPHRGSFQSKMWNRNMVRWLITLPANLVESSLEYYDYMTDDVKKMLGGKKTVFTSADGMSPDNPVIQTLAEIPLAPGVRGHSIIAVKSYGDPKLGNDGVVEYRSAHLDGMASEFIVRNGHSSQLNPLAIDEVRRILVEHISDSSYETAKPK